MATIKDLRISRNWGKRPESDNVIISGNVYVDVEKGQEYDMVQFSINELDKPYMWRKNLCVPCGTSKEQCREYAELFAKEFITDKDIQDYKRFLEDGEKWGWD